MPFLIQDRLRDPRSVGQQIHRYALRLGTNPHLGDGDGHLFACILNVEPITGDIVLDLAGRRFRQHEVGGFRIRHVADRGNELHQAVGPVGPERPPQRLLVASDQNSTIGSGRKRHRISIVIDDRDLISILHIIQAEGGARQHAGKRFRVPLHHRDAGIARGAAAGRPNDRALFDLLFIFPELDRVRVGNASLAKDTHLVSDFIPRFIGNI